MSKIYIIMGKSASGKDTIYKKLLADKSLHLKTIVPYTTRPIRQGETNGVEYFFVSEETMQQLKDSGKIVECRCYETMHGQWYYFTADDGQFDFEKDNYVMITTLVGYEKIRDYYGADRVIPIYIEVEDGLRLERALKREQKEISPRYAEMCRRFLADSEDFSEKHLQAAKLPKRYQNTNVDACLSEVIADIKKEVKR